MSLRRTKDFTGFRQGRLVAIKDVGSNGKSRIWLVRCDCGVEKILGTKSFSPTSLVRSCGCQKTEAAKVVLKTHGMSQHRLYNIWTSMRNRCRNPNDKSYKNYGGRGIDVDSEWDDFIKFVSDMWPTYREGLSIDRIDNNAGYSFGNCRWATPKQQQNNIRKNVDVSERSRGARHRRAKLARSLRERTG
jgi:hypothetical protein